MSDEPAPIDQEAEEAVNTPEVWVMPKPIFRSSDGYTPKTAKAEFEGDDIPTEITNREEMVDAKVSPDVSGEGVKAIVEDKDPKAKRASKRGCASSFVLLISLIGLVAAAVIIALIYFLFYFRPTETGTF